MSHRLLFFLVLFSFSAQAQNWSTFLNSSRAVDWTSAGFSIPNYTVNCSTQPSLSAGSGNASANRTAIQNALNSCDATHNVVNIPAGTWYVTNVSYGTQGKQVIRGAGPNATTVIFTSGVGCVGGLSTGFCMRDSTGYYNGSGPVQPGGSNACTWTAGYAQGSTSITLASCGSAPPLHQTIILDQANDTSDTNGVYMCDTNTTNCGYESTSGGNNNGRFISGKTHSLQQVTYVTGVTSLGGGSYTVTISPGVYFTNIRAGRDAGAWWPGFVQNDGVENITLDGINLSGGATVGMYDCYQCWVKNVRALHGGRAHVDIGQSFQDVVRDSYFYGAQGSGSQSYAIEYEIASGVLTENNIFQQTTTPIMFGAGTGNVIDYNLSIFSDYTGNYVQQAFAGHNTGNNFNLFEGNDFLGIAIDDAWGASAQNAYFRNMLYGWQNGKSENTVPINLRSYARAISVVGNVLGQESYHTGYQTNATSTTTKAGGSEARSIYSLALAGQDSCSSGHVTQCDPLTFSTLMRWGNYDTVTSGVKWDSTEASPVAVPYVNANFTSSYFSSLPHTLPNSLYYSSKPSWWLSDVAWPPIGPGVTNGNIGECSGGTYAGAQVFSSSQCTGGTLRTAWGSYVNAIPAQVCYLNVMNGSPDGSGSVLSFDASQCYESSGGGSAPAPPTGLAAAVN